MSELTNLECKTEAELLRAIATKRNEGFKTVADDRQGDTGRTVFMQRGTIEIKIWWRR